MQLDFEEIKAYDSGEIVEAIEYAVDLATNSWVPPDLRIAVFEAAVRLYTQKVKIPKVPEALKGLIVNPHG
jgi:hypothetical protein